MAVVCTPLMVSAPYRRSSSCRQIRERWEFRAEKVSGEAKRKKNRPEKRSHSNTHVNILANYQRRINVEYFSRSRLPTIKKRINFLLCFSFSSPYIMRVFVIVMLFYTRFVTLRFLRFRFFLALTLQSSLSVSCSFFFSSMPIRLHGNNETRKMGIPIRNSPWQYAWFSCIWSFSFCDNSRLISSSLLLHDELASSCIRMDEMNWDDIVTYMQNAYVLMMLRQTKFTRSVLHIEH